MMTIMIKKIPRSDHIFGEECVFSRTFEEIVVVKRIRQKSSKSPHSDLGTLDPSHKPDRHRNPSGLLLGHAPPLCKIS